MATQVLTQDHNNSLGQLVRRWDRRLRIQQLSLWLPRSLMPGLAIGIVLGVISRLRPLLLGQQILIVAAALIVIGLVVMVIAISLWRRPVIEAARRFDVQFGLKERVSTALELMEGRIQASEEFIGLQIDDALEQAQVVQANQFLPLIWRGREWAVVVVMTVILALVALLPNPQAKAIAANSAQQAAIQSARDELQKITSDVAADPSLTPEERKQLLEALQASNDTLKEPDVKQEEALAGLSTAQSELQAQADKLNKQSQAEQLAANTANQSLNSAMNQSTEAQQQSGQQGLMQSLNNLQQNLSNLTTAQMQQAAQGLQQAASQLQQTNPQAAQALQQAAQQLQQGNQSGAQQALQQATQQLQQAMQDALNQQNSAQQMSQSAQNVQQAANQVSQQNQQGQQQNQGQQSPSQQNQSPNQNQSGQQNQNNQSQQGQQQNQNGQNQNTNGQQNQQGQPQNQNQSGQQQGQQQGQQSGMSQGNGQQQPGQGSQQGQQGAQQAGSQSGAQNGQVTQGSQASQNGQGDSQSQQSQAGQSSGAGDTQGDAGQNGSQGQQGGTPDQNNSPDGEGEGQFDPVYAPLHIGGQGNQQMQVDANSSNQPVKEGNFSENPNGQANVPYNQVFSDYSNAANQALQNDYIPLGMRDVVKEYFSSLEPGQTTTSSKP